MDFTQGEFRLSLVNVANLGLIVKISVQVVGGFVFGLGIFEIP